MVGVQNFLGENPDPRGQEGPVKAVHGPGKE